jgi:hypothetical protein
MKKASSLGLTVAFVSAAGMFGWLASGGVSKNVNRAPASSSLSKSGVSAKAGPPEQSSSHTRPAARETSPILSTQVQPDHAPVTAQRLLADFLLTANTESLDTARRLFPDHPLVLLQCALTAQRPDSPDLARLEAAEPDNALANLLRAGLYAERGDLARFKQELQTAMSKSKLGTGARQRQAEMLDLVIAKGIRGLDPEVYTGFDSAVFDRLGGAYAAFFRNPKLFGDEFTSAEVGVGLAHKLRLMDKSNLSYDMAASQLEIELLRRLNVNDEYGTDGQTIGQRLAQLRRDLQSQKQMAEKYVQPLMSAGGDPVMRLQFFARVRSDGEKAAINWLKKKMDGK